MNSRSLTMTAEDCHGTYEKFSLVEIAREAERRLLAKLRAVPVEVLTQAMRHKRLGEYWTEESAVESVRAALLSAMEDGEE